MNLVYHSRFKKEFRRILVNMRGQFYERVALLLIDRSHPLLGCHPLHGKHEGHWSINVSGDLRALYRIKNNTYIFTRIGTHHELYGN